MREIPVTRSKMPVLQVRNAVFTINNPENVLEFENNSCVRGCVWQLERGESGTEHYQGYIEFNKKMSFKAIKEIIGDRAHVEQRLGTREQAMAYCQKEDTRVDGPWIYGDMKLGKPGKQGDRTDLENACEKIISGGRRIDESLHDIATETPVVYVKYHKGLIALASRLYLRDRTEKPYVEWVWGKTGVGKTLYATTKSDSYYIKDNTQWWDGYEQQDTIILDDFDGKYDFRDLLRLLDPYPFQGQYKGGYHKINSSKIIITCDRTPAAVYPTKTDEEIAQLMRRINDVIHM